MNVHELKTGRFIVAEWDTEASQYVGHAVHYKPTQGDVFTYASTLEGLARVGVPSYATKGAAIQALNRRYGQVAGDRFDSQIQTFNEALVAAGLEGEALDRVRKAGLALVDAALETLSSKFPSSRIAKIAANASDSVKPSPGGLKRSRAR